MSVSPDTKIYIKIGSRRITLPVNPEDISVSHPYVDKTAEIAGVGEILIPQKPGLREVSFSSFLPGSDDDPYVHDYRSPKTIAKAMEKAWRNRTKCRLIISRSNDYDTNMTCVISDWKITDRGGEPDDLYYDVTFREYRSYSVAQMTVINAASGPGANLTPADGQLSQVVTASSVSMRAVDTPQMVVGAPVVLNGEYYLSPQAVGTGGTANGDTGKIARIDADGNVAPYYVDGFGWFAGSSVKLLEEVQ